MSFRRGWSLTLFIVIGTTLAMVQGACVIEKIEDANEAAARESAVEPGTEVRKVSIFDLRTGDCFNPPSNFARPDYGEHTEVERVEVVPCDGDWGYKVVKLILIETAEESSYPRVDYFDGVWERRMPTRIELYDVSHAR